MKTKSYRYVLRRKIEAVRAKPKKPKEPPPMRDTFWKIAELERALDRAIANDKP
jgi:hypothetical protein